MTRDLGDVPGDLPSTSHPLALLPVHLETAFTPADDGLTLLVRIYPDDLHVDGHEPELTAQEQRWGRAFWEHLWTTGTGTDEAERHEVAMWQQLTRRFGTRRAAWLVHALEPRNLADRPAEPTDDGHVPDPQPDFPDPGSRTESWTRAPLSRLLPERWVVTGHRDGRRVLVAWGAPVPPDLPVGPDPQAAPSDDDGGAPVEDGMRWLVDFAEAERVGMAVRVRLDDEDAEQGFDTLLAFGVTGTRPPDDVADQLADLFDAQHHTRGVGFVPQGTATNNTPAATAGYRSAEPDPADSWQPRHRTATFTRGDGTNAGRTAAALGVRPTALAPADHAGDREQDTVGHLQAALWPATFGYHLQQLMDTVDTEAAERGRRLFTERVRARGPLPALRFGRQPYGLLPVAPLNRWTARSDETGDAGLVELLRGLRGHWRQALAHVPRLSGNGEHATHDLVSVLGTTPTSRRYAARPVLDLDHANALLGEDDPHRIGDGLTAARAAVARVLGRADEDDARLPRIARTALARTTVDVTAPLVVSGTSDAGGPSGYLRRLAAADVASLHVEADGPEDDTLLYLLLRHSALVAYASAAREILQHEDLMGSDSGVDAAFVDADDADPTLTLGRCLEQTVPALGDRPIGERIHRLGAADHPGAAGLDELRSNLLALAEAPTVELEAALPEALDVCAHRLDAWVTALASERLDAMRTTHPSGLHVGGYGWVEDLRPATPSPIVDPPRDDPDRTPVVDARDGAGYIHAASLDQAATAAILRSGHRSGPDENTAPFAVDLSSERVRLARSLADGVRGGQSLTVLLGERFERGLHERGLSHLVDVFRLVAPLSQLDQLRRELIDLDRIIEQLESDVDQAEEALADAEHARRIRLDELGDLRTRERTIDSEIAEAERVVTDRRDEFDDADEAHTALRNIYNKQCLDNPTVDPCPDMFLDIERLQRMVTEAHGELVDARKRRDALLELRDDLPRLIREAEDAADQAREEVRVQRELVEERREARRSAGKERYSVRRRYRDLRRERRLRYLIPTDGEDEPMASIAVRDVVDGLALLRTHQSDDVPWSRDFGEHGALPARGSDAHRQAVAELDRLARAVDAVADLYLAEGVYQNVLDDPDAAAAALDVIGRGDAPPPVTDVTRTPRTGTDLEHRVLVLLDAEDHTAPGWPEPAGRARAAAAPPLDAWIGRLLGDPSDATCPCDLIDPATEEVLSTVEVSVADLGLSPLDVVRTGSDAGAPSAELERRFANHALARRPAGMPVEIDVRVGSDRDRAPQLAELLEVARAVGAVLDRARPADGRVVAGPGEDPAPGTDVDELAARADSAVHRLDRAAATARDALEDPDADDERLRSALAELDAAGIPGAVPRPVSGDDDRTRVALREQCRAAVQEATNRLATADEATRDEETDDGRATARLRAVIAGDMPVLARFRAGDPERLGAAFDASDTLQGGDPTVSTTWLQRAARVRDDLRDAATLLLYAEARGMPESSLQVAQLPHEPGDRWVALPTPRDEAMPNGRVSLVTIAPAGLDVSTPLTGLLIDEWSELVPRASETTGVAFNFDDPGARAPQAVLLAVPPDEQPEWDLDTVEETLLDTLDLARLRSVDPDALAHLDGVGVLLPATYLAFNPRGDTVSTDIARAAPPT